MKSFFGLGRGRKYKRVEPDAMRAFYKPYAALASRTPDDVAAVVAQLERLTSIDRRTKHFPVTPAALAAAAAALAEVSRHLEGPALEVTSAAPRQLDQFMDSHLIAAVARPFFQGGSLRPLGQEEAEEGARRLDEQPIPDEPLLYFCLGAWWGEWLVHHRQARWALEAPLAPVQVFPDAFQVNLTTCMLPFSHVVKKLSDPIGDNLQFKGKLLERPRKSLPPFPLLASLADADHACAQLMKPSGREAVRLIGAGEGQAGFDAMRHAIAEDGDNARLLAMGVEHALRGGLIDFAETWQRAILALHPGHSASRHNLAVIFSESGRLTEAVEVLDSLVRDDPGYARARVTCAALLWEVSRPEDAVHHLDWVIANDQELAEEARELRQRLVQG